MIRVPCSDLLRRFTGPDRLTFGTFSIDRQTWGYLKNNHRTSNQKFDRFGFGLISSLVTLSIVSAAVVGLGTFIENSQIMVVGLKSAAGYQIWTTNLNNVLSKKVTCDAAGIQGFVVDPADPSANPVVLHLADGSILAQEGFINDGLQIDRLRFESMTPLGPGAPGFTNYQAQLRIETSKVGIQGGAQDYKKDYLLDIVHEDATDQISECLGLSAAATQPNAGKLSCTPMSSPNDLFCSTVQYSPVEGGSSLIVKLNTGEVVQAQGTNILNYQLSDALDTGGPFAVNTWYYIYVIKDVGPVGLKLTASANNPNAGPAGASAYKYVGSLIQNANRIVRFEQTGQKEFRVYRNIWVTPVTEYGGTSCNSAATRSIDFTLATLPAAQAVILQANLGKDYNDCSTYNPSTVNLNTWVNSYTGYSTQSGAAWPMVQRIWVTSSMSGVVMHFPDQRKLAVSGQFGACHNHPGGMCEWLMNLDVQGWLDKHL